MEGFCAEKSGDQPEKNNDMKFIETKKSVGVTADCGGGGDASTHADATTMHISRLVEAVLDVPLPPASSDEEQEAEDVDEVMPLEASKETLKNESDVCRDVDADENEGMQKQQENENSEPVPPKITRSIFKGRNKAALMPLMCQQLGGVEHTPKGDINTLNTFEHSLIGREDLDDRSDANSSTETLNAATMTPPTYRIKCPIGKCSQILIISHLYAHVIDEHADLLRADTALDFINFATLDIAKYHRKRRRVCRKVYELRLFNNGFDENWLTQIPIFVMTRYVTLADIGGMTLYDEPNASGYLMLWFVGINFKQLPQMCIQLRLMPLKHVRKLKLYCVKMPQDTINVYVSGAAVLFATHELKAMRVHGTNLVNLRFVVTMETHSSSTMENLLLTSMLSD